VIATAAVSFTVTAVSVASAAIISAIAAICRYGSGLMTTSGCATTTKTSVLYLACKLHDKDQNWKNIFFGTV
jgi:hypothetical protein